MFNFAQTYENVTQLLAETQNKGFEALNTLLDVQLKLALSATQAVTTLYAKTPEPFTPKAQTVAKLKDDIELSLTSFESTARDVLNSGQSASEKALSKVVQTGRNVVEQVAKVTKVK